MSWYLWIRPTTEPRDIGLDPSKRSTYTFTVLAKKTPSVTFEEELVKILVDASVGVFGTSIFKTSNARLPTAEPGEAAILTVVSDGGTSPEQEHNADGVMSYQSPSAYISAHCLGDPVAAKTLAYLAYAALVEIKNMTVTIP